MHGFYDLIKFTAMGFHDDLWNLAPLKGLVHPKMKIKSLITHPHAVPTP